MLTPGEQPHKTPHSLPLAGKARLHCAVLQAAGCAGSVALFFFAQVQSVVEKLTLSLCFSLLRPEHDTVSLSLSGTPARATFIHRLKAELL